MALSLGNLVKLNNGTEIPMLGLGVWQIPNGEPVRNAVTWALEAGYRHIDTAKIYRNEQGVGEAIRASKIPREEIWVTTKLWPSDIFRARQAIEGSLERLGLDYVDLYLQHWPVPGVNKRGWKELEKIYADGLAKAVGVSNFSVRQLGEVLEAGSVPPAANQIKISPFDYDAEAVDFSRQKGIAIEAYSPLTRARRLEDAGLQDIASRYQKSAAQILIRWSLQKGFIVLPKSQNRERIKENADVFDFEISAEDMRLLDGFATR